MRGIIYKIVNYRKIKKINSMSDREFLEYRLGLNDPELHRKNREEKRRREIENKRCIARGSIRYTIKKKTGKFGYYYIDQFELQLVSDSTLKNYIRNYMIFPVDTRGKTLKEILLESYKNIINKNYINIEDDIIDFKIEKTHIKFNSSYKSYVYNQRRYHEKREDYQLIICYLTNEDRESYSKKIRKYFGKTIDQLELAVFNERKELEDKYKEVDEVSKRVEVIENRQHERLQVLGKQLTEVKTRIKKVQGQIERKNKDYKPSHSPDIERLEEMLKKLERLKRE